MKSKFLKNLFDCYNIVRALESDDENIKVLQPELKEMDINEFKEAYQGEQVNIVCDKLAEVIDLYAKKRREEEVEETFDNLKLSFQETVKNLIEAGLGDFKSLYDQPFAKELFDEFTDCEEKDEKLLVSVKVINTNINNFTYIKQWWKPKYLENKQIEQFTVSTDSPYGTLFLEADLFQDNFEKGVVCYFRPNKKEDIKISEAVEYLPAHSDELNKTDMPSWIKRIEKGKISIKESNNLEKIVEFSSDSLNNIFKITRDTEDSDFWKLIRIK